MIKKLLLFTILFGSNQVYSMNLEEISKSQSKEKDNSNPNQYVPYNCDLCNEKIQKSKGVLHEVCFDTLIDLNNHIKKTHPLYCKFCKKDFIFSELLKKHTLKKHFQENAMEDMKMREEKKDLESLALQIK